MSEEPTRTERGDRREPEPALASTPQRSNTSRRPTRTRPGNVRGIFTKLGVASLVAAGLSLGMLLVALALGVHCPECDRWKLGDAYVLWSGYFALQHAVALASVLPALAALLVAERRRYAVVARLGRTRWPRRPKRTAASP